MEEERNEECGYKGERERKAIGRGGKEGGEEVEGKEEGDAAPTSRFLVHIPQGK